jgi:hypothetical protein
VAGLSEGKESLKHTVFEMENEENLIGWLLKYSFKCIKIFAKTLL